MREYGTLPVARTFSVFACCLLSQDKLLLTRRWPCRYYRNTLIHLFAAEALIACALLVPEWGKGVGEMDMDQRRARAFEDGVAVEDLVATAGFLRDALHEEFAGVQPADLQPTVDGMLERGLLNTIGSSGLVKVGDGSARIFCFLHALVQPFVTCHAFVAATLPAVCSDPQRILSERKRTDKQLVVALMSKARASGQRLFTADTMNNAIRRLKLNGLFSTAGPRHGRAPELLLCCERIFLAAHKNLANPLARTDTDGFFLPADPDTHDPAAMKEWAGRLAAYGGAVWGGHVAVQAEAEQAALDKQQIGQSPRPVSARTWLLVTCPPVAHSWAVLPPTQDHIEKTATQLALKKKKIPWARTRKWGTVLCKFAVYVIAAWAVAGRLKALAVRLRIPQLLRVLPANPMVYLLQVAHSRYLGGPSPALAAIAGP